MARALGVCLTIGLWLALALVAAPDPVRAADSPALEYQVKAAFLLNFTKFVEWPSTAFAEEHSPLAICILGEDPFGTLLSQMVNGEGVNGRDLIVRRIRRAPEPKSCQVLFIGGSEKDIPKTLAETGPGILTVGEGDGYLRDGGMIAFVIENRRVRFDINRRTAETALLKISSRLLNVARTVEK